MSQSTTALVQKDGKLIKQSIPLPQPDSHQLLVKVSHVAQNPTDVQSLDRNAFGDGTVLGCDFVGTVEKTGDDVKESRAKKGDVVAGLIWGGEIKNLGAYAEHTLADQSICFKIPSSITPTAAATVPLAVATSHLALFSKDSLGIDPNNAKNIPVLIWGGSSSVGLYAIQLARLHSFYPIITTCSPHNSSLVKSHGATYIFDYNSPSVASEISSIAPNLKYIFDTIGNENSSELASQAVRENGEGILCTVRPGKANTQNVRKSVKVVDVLVWTAFLKEHRYAEFVWPANRGDHDLVAGLFDKLPELLESGELVPNPTRVKKGLDKVDEGFQEYRDGKISACKIVYEI